MSANIRQRSFYSLMRGGDSSVTHAGRSNKSPLGLHPSRKQLKNEGAGFTVPELVVSIMVLGILTVSVMSVFANFFATIVRNNELITMTSESQNLLRTISEELRYGGGIRISNTIADPNEPAGGWNTSNVDFVIVTTKPAEDSDETYIENPLTGDPYLNEFVYYKDDSIMYKRTLAAVDANGDPLPGNKVKTSCPPSIATPACPADKKLAETLKTMSFILYDQDDAVTTDPLLARSIVINLLLEKETFGQALQFSNSIRMTLRNDFQ